MTSFAHHLSPKPHLAQDATTPGRLSEDACNSILVDMPADQVPGKIPNGPTLRLTLAGHRPESLHSRQYLLESSGWPLTWNYECAPEVHCCHMCRGPPIGILMTPASAPPRSSPMPRHHGRSLPILLVRISWPANTFLRCISVSCKVPHPVAPPRLQIDFPQIQ